jgi:exonuclease III
MRIVTWNMNYWQTRSTHSAAWEYLQSGLRADVALVQEAVPPAGSVSAFVPIDLKNPRWQWGSAVVSFSRDVEFEPRPLVPLAQCYSKPAEGKELPESHQGGFAAADVRCETSGLELTVVSFYGSWEKLAGGPYESSARVHRMLSDLTGVLARSRRHPVLVAGDFNLSTQHDESNVDRLAAEIADAAFHRLRAWGLVECIAHTRHSRPRLHDCRCLEGENCCHTRTFRGKGATGSLQLDYVFASPAVLPLLDRCTVVDDEVAGSLSDHCPVVVELRS